MSAEYVVGSVEELDEGERLVVELAGREVGVFNIGGEYYALLNWCAHQGGPCCEGPLTGTYDAAFDREALEVELEWVREGEVVNCPWHGWEYDVRTGDCLSDAEVTLPSYPVWVRNGDLVVDLG